MVESGISGDGPWYPGISDSDRISREISKPNGDKVVIFESGAVVVHEVGTAPRTRTPDGALWIFQDGQAVRSMPRRKIPLAERPLNVASTAGEEIGQHLSNFAERPFILDGKRYYSVEAWYQGLKWPEAKKRSEIAKLAGAKAKQAGKGAPPSDHFLYGGTEYKFGSEEHHALVKKAIRASLEQSPEIARIFTLTHPRPIVHDTGREEKASTALPGSKFARILEEIRRELVDRA